MKFILFFLLTASVNSLADICDNTRAPVCPSSGVRVLDDTYPVRAYVISYEAFNDHPGSYRMPVNAIIETMRAYNFRQGEMPAIIVPAQSDKFARLTQNLRTELIAQGKSEAEADALIAQNVKSADTAAYTWQQDYFEATFDQQSGNPRLNFSEVYSQLQTGRQSVERIAGAGVCNVSQGEELRSSVLGWNGDRILQHQRETGEFRHPNAEFGGNIEGLPGGLCLVGDNMAQNFANQVCGNPENTVAVEVSWLQVGHVDEIFKVLPDRRNIAGRPPECAFTILAADTDLGKELLAKPEFANRNAINLNLASDIRDQEAFDATFSTPGGKVLCDAVNATPTPANPGNNNGPSRVLESFIRSVIPSAHALDIVGSQLTCVERVGSVTNNQIWNVLKDDQAFIEYNALIQQAMNRSKEKMYRKILERLPQCRRFFPDVNSMFTRVPNLFSSAERSMNNNFMTEINGQRQLVISPAGAHSLFPNPTNGVIMNNTMIYPGPVATPYQAYLDETTRRLGLTPRGVDSWDYAHAGQGNLHCSSHSIPYCRPGGQR